jgi:vacuolar-type H+-ATPase subunit H
MIESPDIVERLKKLIEDGSGFFSLFDRTLVPRTRAMELIEVLLESLPAEIEQAREIVGKRDEVIEDAKRQAGEIVDEAVGKAEKLVDADVISVEARKRSKEILEDSDRYVAERLLALEEELERLLDEVRAGIRATGGGKGKSGSKEK